MPDVLDVIVGFLDGIGVPAHEGPVPGSSFLPGLRIAGGTLVFDRGALRWPGDLLHEAGHIATTPASMRSSLSDSLDPAVPLPHAGEVEATAWAYAAVVHLGLDPAVLFHSGGYRGHSSGLVATYSLGVYPGAFGLAQAGLTLIGADAARAGVPPYPHMLRWLRA